MNGAWSDGISMKKALRHGLPTLLGLLIAPPALALSEGEALNRAAAEVVEVEAELGTVENQVVEPPKNAEERLAIGDMHLRNRDYPTAIAVLNQVLELYRQGKATDSTRADALFLLGESYFHTGQLPSARRHFRTVALEGHREAYNQHAGRSLSRLVDIAMRRGFPDELDFVFEQLSRLGATDSVGAIRYAAGKAHFAAGHYQEAISELRAMPKGSPLAFQAAYLAGVIFTNQTVSDNAPSASQAQLAAVPEVSRRFARAILQFQRVTAMKPETAAQKHIVDLAWLALGRLFYETENPLDAVDAYDKVGRDSPEFARKLFELAWVYVSLKDYSQARHTLEVLEVVAPESLGLAEGALLRADLLLRSKEFPQALRAYEGVTRRFAPAYDQLDAFLQENDDPASFYDSLVEQRLGARTGRLPPVVMDWVREVEDERAFALIDDVTRSRQLTRESRRMARTMGGVLSAPTRARAFPALRAKFQGTLALSNRLAKAKLALAAGLDDAMGAGSGEAGKLQGERRKITSRVLSLPVEIRNFLAREAQAHEKWDETSQTLQQLSLQTDQMRATVNGLRRVLRESDEFGITLSASRRAELTLELRASERDLDVYQKQISELRDAVERGRLQVGFGGSQYEEDERVKQQLSSFVGREMRIAATGESGEAAQEYSRLAMATLARIARAEKRLSTMRGGYEREVAEASGVLLRQVDEEAQKVEADAARLDVLDQLARQLFGELAKRSFMTVREKLGSILLRADVGVAQEAWEVRQSHFDMVQELQRTKAEREQYLNEEYQDVLLDGSPGAPGMNPGVKP